MKRIFGWAIGVGVLAGATACAAAPVGPTGDGPVAAFYGDSYTLGTGASDPAKRWSTIICEDRGWAEFNPSANGLGFVNNRAAFGYVDLPGLIIDENPDIVFVTMGLNDNFSYGLAASEIEEQITTDLERLSDELPDARIVVVEPFWYMDERPDSVNVIIGWVEDAAADIGADYIAGASHWLDGHPEWISGDGLHPNDEGYAEFARRMDAELTLLEI